MDGSTSSSSSYYTIDSDDEGIPVESRRTDDGVGTSGGDGTGTSDSGAHNACQPHCIVEQQPELFNPPPLLSPLESRSVLIDEQAKISAAVYATGLKLWQVRILALHPGDLNAPLVADLVVADSILDRGIVLHDQQRKVE